MAAPVRIPHTGGAAACPEESEEASANSSAAPATFHGYGQAMENDSTARAFPGKAIGDFMKVPAAERLGEAMGPMERNFWAGP
ncbi:MAG: hypothetical protein LBI69_00175 [Puniceicoccales bacterium]|nr:hypothetical protein [Puniceicoccales bacterium]